MYDSMCIYIQDRSIPGETEQKKIRGYLGNGQGEKEESPLMGMGCFYGLMKKF